MVKSSRETNQKKIISEIVEKQTGFFTAEEIYKQIKNKNMGIATVYRFLKSQRKQNKLYSYLCNRRMLYSNEKKSHCHYICEKTGKISHFEIDNLNFLNSIRKQIPGNITSIQLEIKGICEDCQKS